jgi:hypothetical protein
MGCEEVQRLLEERVVACRGEVERLRIEAERIAELIGAREAELLRLDTARQVVRELPAAHVVATSSGGVPAQRPGPGTAGAVTARTAKTEEFTARVRQVHQVRSMASLGASSTDRPAWATLMAKKQRKTLVVCTPCHDVIHGQSTTLTA